MRGTSQALLCEIPRLVRNDQSEPQTDAGPQTVIGDNLQRGILDRHRKLSRQFARPFPDGRDRSRTNKHGGDAGVLGRFAAKPIGVFLFARDYELQADDRVRLPTKIEAGTSAPQETVCEIVLMRAISAQRELRVCLKEE